MKPHNHLCGIPIKNSVKDSKEPGNWKSSPTANSTTPIDTHLRVPQQPDNQPSSRSCSFKMLCNTATCGILRRPSSRRSLVSMKQETKAGQATRGHHRFLRPVLAALHVSLCCDGSL
ncbi:hypothetical protein CEXT_721551 [Caerostris extrusa]|uniref:Uncharacterized protein n=1 Tax=Caerostris extrusa TaxID=172846 RepID=A0AAV4QER5_CAEEX|nr:hypothetical protein CEXT_721551 [Caerostris extrusa]